MFCLNKLVMACTYFWYLIFRHIAFSHNKWPVYSVIYNEQKVSFWYKPLIGESIVCKLGTSIYFCLDTRGSPFLELLAISNKNDLSSLICQSYASIPTHDSPFIWYTTPHQIRPHILRHFCKTKDWILP